MTSEVEICNIALSNIRAGSINSLTESSLQAQQCKLKYALLRDRCLTTPAWVFNKKVRALSVLTTDVFTWSYAYQYPVDALKIHRLVGAQEQLPHADASVISRTVDRGLFGLNNLRLKIPYEVFNFDNVKTIGANDSDLRVIYSAKVTDPNLFSVDFIMALSHLLSSELAIPLVGVENGRQLRNDSLTLYTKYFNAAMADNANDGYSEPVDSEFITIRS